MQISLIYRLIYQLSKNSLTPEILGDLALPTNSTLEPILPCLIVHNCFHSLSLTAGDERAILKKGCQHIIILHMRNWLTWTIGWSRGFPAMTTKCASSASVSSSGLVRVTPDSPGLEERTSKLNLSWVLVSSPICSFPFTTVLVFVSSRSVRWD